MTEQRKYCRENVSLISQFLASDIYSKTVVSLLMITASFFLAQDSAAAPVIIDTQLSIANVGEMYEVDLVVSSEKALASYSVEGLPSGVSATLSELGVIRINGAPLQSGTFKLNITVVDIANQISRTTLDLHVFASMTTDITDVSIGSFSGCLLRQRGVYCWGTNNSGQVGDGTAIYRSRPIEVIPPSANVSQVSVGSAHACAVVDAGVMCWGANTYGGIGDGSDIFRLVPTVILPIRSGVTRVSAGFFHTCAVINGGLSCWGYNSYGQIGDGSTVNRPTPVQIFPAGSGVSDVAAGFDQTCVLIRGGVQCWGTLLNGVREVRPIVVIPEATGVTTLSMRFRHVCVIVNAALQCWGSNAYGQLGVGNTKSFTTPQSVSSLSSNVTSVSAGLFHTCAIANGKLSCWGGNNSGQLGIGSRSQSTIPTTVALPSSFIPSFSAGIGQQNGDFGAATCAVVDGKLMCWGYGTPSNTSIYGPSYPIRRVAGDIKLVQSIAAGSGHTCTTNKNEVYCWGLNELGELGIGTVSQSTSALKVALRGNNITDLSTKFQHSCAIVDAGVQCWGDNKSGQLGDGTRANTFSPVVALPFNSGVTGVTTGETFTCFIANSGVRCWGENDVGQLGNGTRESSLTPVVAIAAGSNVTKITANRNSVCALANGGVLCWGSSYEAAGNRSRTRPTEIIARGSEITDIGIGYGLACAVIRGGLDCWATSNENLQLLGLSDGVKRIFPANSDVTGFAGGMGHICVIISGGVRCLGSNYFGQLGVNTVTQSSKEWMQIIESGAQVSGITAGRDHTCALVAKVPICWGSNQYGEIGQRLTSPILEPRIVPIALDNASPLNYSDMWWAGQQQSGWGISILQHAPSHQQFNVIYDYGSGDFPKWYVMPGGKWDKAFARFTGELYQPQGSRLDTYRPESLVVGLPVGSATVSFFDDTNATLSYKIGNVTGTTILGRQQFRANASIRVPDVADMWWGGATQNGWGLNLSQQSSALFGVWYTYGPCQASCQPIWYVLPGGNWSETNSTWVYTGNIYETRGSFNLIEMFSYDASRSKVINAGTFTLAFAKGSTLRPDSATFTYQFTAGIYAGISQSKTIVRQIF